MNMNKFKIKFFIFSILCAVCISLVFSMQIIHKHFEEKKDKNMIFAATYSDSYYDAPYGVRGSYYNDVYSKQIIEIRSQEDFDHLINASQLTYDKTINDYGASHTFTDLYLYDFVGKTIKLYTNVSAKKNIPNEFYGELDGQGYTISGATISAEAELLGNDDYLGIFNIMNGSVKNTRFKNFSFTIKSTFSTNTYAAVIAGENNGTISNCIIENCSFLSERYKSNCYVGSIAGDNNGTITNCMVIGTYTVGGKGGNFLSNADGLTAGYFTAGTSGNISNVVFRANFVKTHSKEDYKKNLIIPDYTTTGSLYNTIRDGFSYLSKSAEGGSSGTTWYYAKEYNNGWPTLRSFINGWTTIGFVSTNSEAGSVSKTSIKVPSDADSSKFDDYNNSTSESISIYSQIIKADPDEDNGYEFEKWTYVSSTKTYTAHFKVEPQYLSFFDDDETQYGNAGLSKLMCGVKGSGTYTTGTEFYFQVDSGSTIKFDFLETYDGKSISKTGCYIAVKINFKGKIYTDDNNLDTTAKDYEMIFVVTSSSHYITSCVNILDLIANTDKDVVIEDTMGVWIDIELKSYNVTFG